MPINRSLSAIIFACFAHLVFAQSNEKVKALAIKYANRHCSNATEILQAEEAKSIAFYMDNEVNEIDIGNFGTAVHEGLHNYDWELGSAAENATPEWGDRYKAYFVNTDIVISTEEKRVFKTSTMHRNYFPEAVKEMSRYETYIQEWGDDVSDENSKLSQDELEAYGVKELRPGEARTTSNVKGIYGLMEEFNAYHHGIKAEYELISGMEDPKVSGSTNSLAAYFEFNVFMAYYLKFARERERGVYDLLMNDRNLRIAYTLIELSWRELITQIYNHDLATSYFMYWRDEPELLTNDLRSILTSFMIPVTELEEYQKYARSKNYASDIKALVLEKIEENGSGSGSWSPDLDVDWDNWDNDNGNSTSEITINLTPMMGGKHYVVVDTETDLFALVDKMSEFEGQGIQIGSGMDMEKYYFFIGEFGSLTEARENMKKHKAKYPKIKVVSWK